MLDLRQLLLLNDLRFKYGLLYLLFIFFYSRSGWKRSSTANDWIIFPSGFEVWLLSIRLLSSWFCSAAFRSLWFFNFFYFFFSWLFMWLFTLFYLWWIFSWACIWAASVTFRQLLQPLLTLSQIGFFLNLVSPLHQVLYWTVRLNLLGSSRCSYTFGNLSCLTWKGTNFNFSYPFHFFHKLFSFLLICFQSSSCFAIVLFRSNRRCL